MHDLNPLVPADLSDSVRISTRIAVVGDDESPGFGIGWGSEQLSLLVRSDWGPVESALENPVPADVTQTVPLLTPLDALSDPSERKCLANMRQIWQEADPIRFLADVPPTRIPRHIAIIMDGNGRWAQRRGFAREFGHRAGAVSVRRILEAAVELGVECLTLYSFSSENWRRPAGEVEALMRLYLDYMDGERGILMARNIRFRQIGRREGLPKEALEALDRTIEATSENTGPILCLAVNYGGREEIVDAARRLGERVMCGEIQPKEINELALETELSTSGLPDPDLLIRTAGEFRLSNFLLWQLSYAEIHVTQQLWPDFTREDLHEAIRDFARRERRFGGISSMHHPGRS